MGFIGVWGVWVPCGDADFRCRGQTWRIMLEKTEHDTISRVSKLQSISKWPVVPNLLLP
jgi:hypothetical protein